MKKKIIVKYPNQEIEVISVDSITPLKAASKFIKDTTNFSVGHINEDKKLKMISDPLGAKNKKEFNIYGKQNHFSEHIEEIHGAVVLVRTDDNSSIEDVTENDIQNFNNYISGAEQINTLFNELFIN